LRAPPVLDHLAVLTDDTGVVQHATYDVPNRSTGYCTDDVARGFIVACTAARHDDLRAQALRLGSTYLSFLHDAQLPDGAFHNFMAHDRTWLDDAGSEDSWGRAVWALGFGARRAPRDGWRALCATMVERSLAAVALLEHPRAQAFAALGLAHALSAGVAPERVRALLRRIGDEFVALNEAARGPGWDWFEDALTYDNARLSEAALRIGMALGDQRMLDLGSRTLAFYESVVFEGGIFVPIGNDGWYRRGRERARFDQQPLEAAALVDAELAAYEARGDESRYAAAERAFAWFEGANSLGVSLLEGGGCGDGLSQEGPSGNRGAESTLAYLSAALALAEARRPLTAK
jgi:hypothetical protein